MCKFILAEPHTELGPALLLPYARKSFFLQLVGTRAGDGGGDTQPSALPGLPTPDPALQDQLILCHFRCRKSLLYSLRNSVM